MSSFVPTNVRQRNGHFKVSKREWMARPLATKRPLLLANVKLKMFQISETCTYILWICNWPSHMLATECLQRERERASEREREWERDRGWWSQIISCKCGALSLPWAIFRSVLLLPLKRLRDLRDTWTNWTEHQAKCWLFTSSSSLSSNVCFCTQQFKRLCLILLVNSCSQFHYFQIIFLETLVSHPSTKVIVKRSTQWLCQRFPPSKHRKHR